MVTATPADKMLTAASGTPEATQNGPGVAGRGPCSACTPSSAAVNMFSALAWCALPRGTGTHSSSAQAPLYVRMAHGA